MLAHAIDEADFAALDPRDFRAEWKWDGIRVQAVPGCDADGPRDAAFFAHRRRYLRAPFPISSMRSAPCRADAFALDGELLVLRDGLVQTFAVLQQRLNRKTVSAETARRISGPYPRLRSARARHGEDLRALPFAERRATARSIRRALRAIRASISRRSCRSRPGRSWPPRAPIRRRPAPAPMREAIEGVMLKRARFDLCAGPAEGPVVQMEARSVQRRRRADVCAARPRQALVVLFRLHLRGLARATSGDELVPVGKAYFGFTDEELRAARPLCARHIRSNRFGPVREVEHDQRRGLVLEIAFEGLQPLDAPQIRRRHALSAHRAHPLGQARRAKRTRIETLEALLRDQ